MPSAFPPSLIDRLATSFIAAFVMAIMAVGMPMGLLIVTRGKALQFLGAYLSFAQWGSGVPLAAAVVGLVMGSERTVVLFGHLSLIGGV